MADKRLLVGAIDAAGDTLFGSWAGVSGAGAAVQRSASDDFLAPGVPDTNCSALEAYRWNASGVAVDAGRWVLTGGAYCVTAYDCYTSGDFEVRAHLGLVDHPSYGSTGWLGIALVLDLPGGAWGIGVGMNSTFMMWVCQVAAGAAALTGASAPAQATVAIRRGGTTLTAGMYDGTGVFTPVLTTTYAGGAPVGVRAYNSTTSAGLRTKCLAIGTLNDNLSYSWATGDGTGHINTTIDMDACDVAISAGVEAALDGGAWSPTPLTAEDVSVVDLRYSQTLQRAAWSPHLTGTAVTIPGYAWGVDLDLVTLDLTQEPGPPEPPAPPMPDEPRQVAECTMDALLTRATELLRLTGAGVAVSSADIDDAWYRFCQDTAAVVVSEALLVQGGRTELVWVSRPREIVCSGTARTDWSVQGRLISGLPDGVAMVTGPGWTPCWDELLLPRRPHWVTGVASWAAARALRLTGDAGMERRAQVLERDYMQAVVDCRRWARGAAWLRSEAAPARGRRIML